MRFNKLIPELSVSDINKSTDFYTKILGFKIEYQRKESNFVFLSYQGSQIMIDQVNDNWKTGPLKYPFGCGINFQFDVKGLQRLVSKLKKNKYPIRVQPKENWYRVGKKLCGQREFLVQDPDGYLLRFAEDIGTKPLKEK